MPSPAVLYRQGFGHIARTINWTDYAFPYSFGSSDSQYGQGVAIRVKAMPDRPAIIDSIKLVPAFNKAGTNQAYSVRSLVLRGDIPNFSQMFDIQSAVNFYPLKDTASLYADVLWEDIRGADSMNAAYQTTHEFPNGGPFVSPNEVMTILTCLLFNQPTIGYGAANQTYLSMTVTGRGDGRALGDDLVMPSDSPSRLRSLQRGMIG